jgi:hypothetical protein
VTDKAVSLKRAPIEIMIASEIMSILRHSKSNEERPIPKYVPYFTPTVAISLAGTQRTRGHSEGSRLKQIIPRGGNVPRFRSLVRRVRSVRTSACRGSIRLNNPASDTGTWPEARRRHPLDLQFHSLVSSHSSPRAGEGQQSHFDGTTLGPRSHCVAIVGEPMIDGSHGRHLATCGALITTKFRFSSSVARPVRSQKSWPRDSNHNASGKSGAVHPRTAVSSHFTQPWSDTTTPSLLLCCTRISKAPIGVTFQPGAMVSQADPSAIRFAIGRSLKSTNVPSRVR